MFFRAKPLTCLIVLILSWVLPSCSKRAARLDLDEPFSVENLELDRQMDEVDRVWGKPETTRKLGPTTVSYGCELLLYRHRSVKVSAGDWIVGIAGRTLEQRGETMLNTGQSTMIAQEKFGRAPDLSWQDYRLYKTVYNAQYGKGKLSLEPGAMVGWQESNGRVIRVTVFLIKYCRPDLEAPDEKKTEGPQPTTDPGKERSNRP